MRFNNKFDLNLLVALDHLLHLRSVSGAAARMNMTQSAMSNALLRLRTYFDDELLVKIGRKMELTPRAEVLKDSIRDLLVRVDWAIASSAQFDPAQSDRCFKILASDYTLVTMIPRLMARTEALAPGIRFDFIQQVQRPERALERGDVDLLIIPEEFSSKLHPSELIFEDDFCVIAWSKGRFGKGKLSRQEFARASHVVMRPAATAQSLESYYLEQRNMSRSEDVSVYAFTAIPHLVAGTNRIATVHRRLAVAAQRSLPIRIIELPVSLPALRQRVQWHRYRSNDAGLLWLRELMREVVAELP
ncbi:MULTISPECIES: LysR family transcriptional regulator [unclassified Bradyrhizobium]|uniref:LysR family transcriptional regulator n=1 Tax=unclassified Bradyrhizobium TaxID=2631580 RepID=UPI0028E2E56F|nr:MULTISPECIES: LysR family transcriptional regulator [unclassified Bradyrhizobium]